MNENPNCQLCPLHESAHPKSVCLKGKGGDLAPLLIFLDGPNMVEDRRHRGMVSEQADLLQCFLRRMSLTEADYHIEYIIKCYAGNYKPFSKKADRQNIIQSCSIYRLATLQHLQPKSVVAMGRVSCEAFLGSDEIKNYEGTKWTPKEPFVRDFITDVWITYAPAFALQDPSASVGIYRVLQTAAIEAGLSPTFNRQIKLDYGT